MKRKTVENFKKEVLRLTDSEYECVGEYINNKTPTIFYHAICKSYFTMKPNKFLAGHRCPTCNKMCRKNIVQAREKVMAKNDTMFILEDYSGMTKPAKFVHTECGGTFYLKPADVIRGKKCPFCSDKVFGKSEIFQNRLIKKFPDILLTERFISPKKKIQFICRQCNSRFSIKPEELLKLEKCPGCEDKAVSERIGIFLLKAEIPFKRNEEFFNGTLMSFDYFLPDFNLAIDYAGFLYYDAISGISSSSNEKYKRKLKADYCRKNKIKYLQIPFWKADSVYHILYSLFMSISEKSSYTAYIKWKQHENLRII